MNYEKIKVNAVKGLYDRTELSSNKEKLVSKILNESALKVAEKTNNFSELYDLAAKLPYDSKAGSIIEEKAEKSLKK